MKTRLTLKLTLPYHEKMLVPLKSALTEFLQQLQQADAHAEIKCWRALNQHCPNLSPNIPMPNSMQDIRNYLNRLFFPKNTTHGVTIYTHILLGYDNALEDIREHLSE